VNPPNPPTAVPLVSRRVRWNEPPVSVSVGESVYVRTPPMRLRLEPGLTAHDRPASTINVSSSASPLTSSGMIGVVKVASVVSRRK